MIDVGHEYVAEVGLDSAKRANVDALTGRPNDLADVAESTLGDTLYHSMA